MAKMMTEEARAAYNAYQREWRKAHPETVRAYRKKHAATFWEKKAREAAQAATAAVELNSSGDAIQSGGDDQSGEV